MTRSELVYALAQRQPLLDPRDLELSVHSMLEFMVRTMATGDRIEIRDFGSFAVHHCEATNGA